MPTGISIHIGLNELDAAHYRGLHPLRGCLGDAHAMHDLAKDAGFEPRLITGKAATVDAVRNAIAEACPLVGSDGILLVTFSGHGSRVKNLVAGRDKAAASGSLADGPAGAVEGVVEPAGVDRFDTGDGWDETWCLYDRQLVDDELYACWTDFPRGARILVVSDSCLSAGVVRGAKTSPTAPSSEHGAEESPKEPRPMWDPLELDAPPATPSATPPTTRSARSRGTRSAPLRQRALQPVVSRRIYQLHRKTYTEIQRNVRERPWRPVVAEVLLLAASEDNRPAMDGETNGAFTAALLEVWDGGNFQGGYREFHKAIRDRLTAQVPRLLALRKPAFAHQRPFSI